MTTIRLLSTGGTVAMTLDHDGGAMPTVSAASLASFARVRTPISFRELARVGGPAITAETLDTLYEEVQAPTENVQGVIITHGTDTIEETSFFLALTVEPRVPIVLTGAINTHDHPRSDGPKNIAFAAATIEQGLAPGIYVAFSGRLFGGLTVTKIDSHSEQPFADLEHVHDALPLVKYTGFALPVWIAKPGMLDDLQWVENIDARGAQSLIVEATGVGNVPPGSEKPLVQLAQRIPVLLTSRCLHSKVERKYGYEGGSLRLIDQGLIPCSLPSAKARLLASLTISSWGAQAQGRLRQWLS